MVVARKRGEQGRGAGEGIFVLRGGRQEEEGSRRAAVVVLVLSVVWSALFRFVALAAALAFGR